MLETVDNIFGNDNGYNMLNNFHNTYLRKSNVILLTIIDYKRDNDFMQKQERTPVNMQA
jgi:hypothetical protein